MPDARSEELHRTSAVYRRMTAPDLPRNVTPAPRDQQQPSPARTPALPKAPPGNPGFVRRMLTRPPDLREWVLLGIVLLALLTV